MTNKQEQQQIEQQVTTQDRNTAYRKRTNTNNHEQETIAGTNSTNYTVALISANIYTKNSDSTIYTHNFVIV